MWNEALGGGERGGGGGGDTGKVEFHCPLCLTSKHHTKWPRREGWRQGAHRKEGRTHRHGVTDWELAGGAWRRKAK